MRMEQNVNSNEFTALKLHLFLFTRGLTFEAKLIRTRTHYIFNRVVTQCKNAGATHARTHQLFSHLSDVSIVPLLQTPVNGLYILKC